jgi:hypothetical protein
MACKGWTNSNNALEQRLVVGEDTLLHIFLAAVAALTYPPTKARSGRIEAQRSYTTGLLPPL